MMAEAKPIAGTRPLAPKPMSPHLSIYRFKINMILSIMHRVTGIINYFGSLILAIWIVSAATSENAFNTISSYLATPLGLLILIGFTWSVMHHMLGGIRHFIWDVGWGFSKKAVKFLSWASLFGSITLTAIIWGYALSHWGHALSHWGAR